MSDEHSSIREPVIPVGRFAPSPSGPLHAGSIATALASWLDARARRGRWLVRIEDIDPPREQPGADRIILGQLQALGLRPDGDVVYQSTRTAAYEAALAKLRADGRAYGCACTRRELALHRPDGRYPGTCRGTPRDGRPVRAWRFAIDDGQAPVCFDDAALGWHCDDVARESGNFVVRRADGLWAYQLAVVVDDAAASVTHVVRGRDLLDSTGRQVLLQRALGLPTPAYRHVPLVLAADGRKLSKQNGAPAVDVGRPVAVLNDAMRALGLPVPEGCPAGADVATWLAEATALWARADAVGPR